MPIIAWDETLTIGHAVIDRQHQKLIGLINLLYDAADSDCRNETVCRMIDELTRYATEHFVLEERLMADQGFEGAAEHMAQHRFFTQEVALLGDACAANYAPYKATLDFLMHWLVEHIIKQDMQLRPLAQAGE